MVWRRAAAACYKPSMIRGVCGVLGIVAAVTAAVSTAAVLEPFETGTPSLERDGGDVEARVSEHARVRGEAHRGEGCERITVEVDRGSSLRFRQAFGPAAVIDELAVSLWIRSNRPGVRLLLRVELPHTADAATGRPLAVTLPGDAGESLDRWERLTIRNPAELLRSRLPALRAEHGTEVDLTAAVATGVVLELSSGPGSYQLAVDDLEAEGLVLVERSAPAAAAAATASATLPDGGVRPVSHEQPAEAASDPPAGIHRGVLEVGGMPFFPRFIDHHGEPLELLARLGFNGIRLNEPASGELLDEARQAGMWIACPPPSLPDVDLRDPASLPAFSPRWNRVLLWDLGEGLAEADAAELAERARRVKTCDLRPGRPVIASADSSLRTISRHVDLLVARRRVLGTSLELSNYLEWLRQRPRLARPGTPIMATLATEIDPDTAAQAEGLSGHGAAGLAVNAGSLRLASLSAVAAGVRGLFFRSLHRIDQADPETRSRAAAAWQNNLDLSILEPWAAAGRFASTATTSDPEVKAVVLEAVRARMVVVWRSAQGSQVSARPYRGDLPDDDGPVSLLVPGVPEAHQAWLVAAGGLRPIKQKRVTGGVSVALEPFRGQGFVLFSGDPAITGSVQRRLQEIARVRLSAARELASVSMARSSALIAGLPPAAIGQLPATAMLARAGQEARTGEAVLATDPSSATEAFETAAAISGQFTRLVWERGVVATGSMVAGPLSASEGTIGSHWQFVETLAMTRPGEALLEGGSMERIEDLADAGWRHFKLPTDEIQTSVEVMQTGSRSHGNCLQLRAAAVNEDDPPVVVETPPVWITTPPLNPPEGRLVEIRARVRVPADIAGSADGLLVFDSWGGPALAERVGPTKQWRMLTLYRIAPPRSDAGESPPPLVVTFAMTGLGKAFLDDVSVRVRSRVNEAAGSPTVAVDQWGPRPAAIRPPPAATAGTPPTSRAWPGTLGWPSIFPFGSTTAPEKTADGGHVDPFKKARGAQP